MTAIGLGLLGLVLSHLVPRGLAAARWPDRVPGPAVLLWQSTTLAAVLCAVGVVLAAPEELTRAAGSGRRTAVVALAGALTVAAVIVVRLLHSLTAVMRGSRARRERHRVLVDLLDSAERHHDLRLAASPGQLRVLEGAVPFAYCLPGRSPRVVLSAGTLEVLTPDEVAAVLAHEQAHLRARHDLVTEAFLALYRALPGPLRSRTSLDAVQLLLEMVADDAARRRAGAGPLAAALERLAGGEPGGWASTGDLAATRRRLDRLSPAVPATVRGRRVATVLAVLASAGVLVLPTVVLVMPWLARAIASAPVGAPVGD